MRKLPAALDIGSGKGFTASPMMAAILEIVSRGGSKNQSGGDNLQVSLLNQVALPLSTESACSRQHHDKKTKREQRQEDRLETACKSIRHWAVSN